MSVTPGTEYITLLRPKHSETIEHFSYLAPGMFLLVGLTSVNFQNYQNCYILLIFVSWSFSQEAFLEIRIITLTLICF